MNDSDSTNQTQTPSGPFLGLIRFLVVLIVGVATALVIIMIFPVLVAVVDLLLGVALLYILIVALPRSLYLGMIGQAKSGWRDGLEQEISRTRKTFSGFRSSDSGQVVN